MTRRFTLRGENATAHPSTSAITLKSLLGTDREDIIVESDGNFDLLVTYEGIDFQVAEDIKRKGAIIGYRLIATQNL